jgi:hypothetical protein
VWSINYLCAPFFVEEISQKVFEEGLAVAQAVNVTARVWARVTSCGICGGQSGTLAGFLAVLQSPLPLIPSIICSTINSTYHPGLVQ